MKQTPIFLQCLLLILISACPVISQDSNSFHGFRAGQYTGQALNTTYNQRGKIVLDLYDIRATGKVEAYFGASDGLTGEAWLNGTIDRRGELDLTGSLADFRIEIQGHVTPQGSITATYRLDGASHQDGNFEASFQHDLEGAPSNKAFANLIGAWEIGGGMPAEVSPITGRATGISFVEARRLEIFPDGEFKHVLSHRHCESGCCREDATLEQGTISFEGQNLVFDIAGGGTITRNSCNPRLGGQGTVKRQKERFPWTFKQASAGNAPELCIQLSNGESTCYKKQP